MTPVSGIVEVVIPQVGEAVSEVRIVRWLKAVGDVVERGDVLFEVDTEKATIEIEAFTDGVLKEIRLVAGAAAQAQMVAALLEVPGPGPPTCEEQRSVDQHSRAGSLLVRATPRAKAMARELGVDLNTVVATGPDGMITANDVTAAGNADASGVSSTAPAPIPLTSMRRTIARRTTASKQRVPHFYLLREVDMEAVALSRERIEREKGRAPSITSYVVAACAYAFRECPDLNMSFGTTGHLQPRSEIRIGIAVALGEGLILPIVRRADDYDLAALDREVRGVVERARDNRLDTGDLGGERSIVVSNLGSAGVDAFLAIIDEPDAFILSVGRISERYVRRNHIDGFRHICTLGLSADHRAVDGIQAARLLDRIASRLEDPR